MAPAAPQLPTRFPCWCRAVYSWGGETKKDLGFIEGDLIECLNAGDGQWWMGRLRRDRRMAGLFPSNFVEVLGEDFVPKTRATSPMVQAGPSPIANPTSAPKKQKTVFRKPFQAHKEALAPSAELARNNTTTNATNASTSSIPQPPPRNGTLPRSVKSLRTPGASTSRQQSPLARPASRSRAASPQPPPPQDFEPPVSSALVKHSTSRSGALSRPVSPYAPYEQDIAPAPPASSMRQDYSRPPPPLHSGSHYMLPEPDMPPEVPTRQIVPQPMYKARSASPNPPYEPDIGPVVPLRHNNTFHSTSPARPISPYVAYNPDIPPPVPVRQGIPRSGPSPRPVSPAMSYDEPDFPPPVPARQNFPQPVQQYRALSPRPLSPRPVSSRPVSPRPVSPSVSYESDVPPPVPVRQHTSISRPVSRGVSPVDFEQEREDSPPPPPPPPHRVGVNRPPSRESRAPAPLDMNDRYVTMSRTPSPAASRSDVNEGNTPSPLRDAMEDVMSSLEGMEMSRGGPSPSPPAFKDPWSPDAYDDFKSETKSSKTSDRPLTSMGFDRDGDKDHYNTVNGAIPHRNSVYAQDHYADGPPQLNNYVQRMESRLRQLQKQNRRDSEDVQDSDGEESPLPPPKNVPYHGRHNSSPIKRSQSKARRTGRDLRDDILNRSFTNKSSTTNSSSGIQSNSTNMTSSTGRTSQSLMSGQSAGGFSATSAGSFRRRAKTGAERPNTSMDARTRDDERPETPLTGVSYHSSHNTSRQGASSAIPWSSTGDNNVTPTAEEPSGVFGGLSTPKATKKQGFFKRIFDSAKTGAANARSSIAVGGGQTGGSYSPTKGRPVSPIRSPTRSPHVNKDTGRDGGGSSMDWVQVRRDVNRAVSPSPNERMEKAEKCQMLDRPVIYAVEEFYETIEGDESIDGLPISEPTNFSSGNLNLVDKSARFVNSLPPLTNPTSLAHGYVCRPYKSDVQRLRAIFTWVSEKIAWDEPVEELEVDLKRVLHTKRGCSQEVAYLVKEMCAAVGLYAEAIRGYLKTPGEFFDLESLSRPNHWWNSVLVDGEWRAMDCSLANPTNPQRAQFASNSSPTAESWYFLARPTEICFTHVPVYPEEQHICPPISPDVLLALPAACPAYFKHEMKFPDYDTSILYIEGLEAMQFRLLVPPDVECAAEVEAPSFARDADGDYFESGEIVRKRALVQPEWVNGQKRYTVKAILPGDEGQGMVKVYAGKRGLMHTSRDIPHPVALAVPISHIGENPPYDFVLRHPTPHAQRHDLYIMQPQCARLAINNTFVFAVRQHPASMQAPSTGNEQNTDGRVSPSPFARPASALSMLSSSVAGSSVSGVSNEFSASTSAISSRSGSGREKPAKLAIQSPSGKILRLSRKADHMLGSSSGTDPSIDAPADGSVWETVIKIGERGTWRGLVLADRVARWCVFSEWECS